MHRIDSSTAAATLPAPAAAGTPGYFTAGNPAAGIPPTSLTNDFFNALQEEIVAVLAAAGIAPDKTNNGQLLAAIRVLVGGGGTSGSNANGYWEKRATNIMEQWGVIASASSTEGVVAVVFPVPFADTSYVVSPVGFINAASQYKDTWPQIIENSKTVNGFSVQYQNPADAGTATYGLDGVEWRAIGKWS